MTKEEFTSYLHNTFRVNIYQARLEKDPYQRASLVLNEISKLQDMFKEVYPDHNFVEWMETNNFRINTANGQRKIPIYVYTVKYLTTGHYSKSSFNHEFYMQHYQIKGNTYLYQFMDGDYKNFTQTYYFDSEKGEEVSIFDKGVSASPFEMEDAENTRFIEVERDGHQGQAMVSPDVYEALEELKPLHYHIIEGHYFEDKDLCEIASIRGVSASYISKEHKKALDNLIKLLPPKGEVKNMSNINTNPIMKDSSLKDYTRWYGNTKPNYSEYCNVGAGKKEMVEPTEVTKGQIIGDRIVWEDGTSEDYQPKKVWKNPYKYIKN